VRNWDAALDYLESAGSNTYRKVDLLVSLGCSYCERGQYVKGIQNFARIIDLLGTENVGLLDDNSELQDMHVLLAWAYFYGASCLMDSGAATGEIYPRLAIVSGILLRLEDNEHQQNPVIFSNSIRVPPLNTLREGFDRLREKVIVFSAPPATKFDHPQKIVRRKRKQTRETSVTV
jgi:hypothetical protein